MRSIVRVQPHAALWAGVMLLFATATPVFAADKVEVLSVTASSTDGMLMDAVDGDPTTAWQNKHPGEHDAWLGVHFADTSKLKGVKLLLDALGPDTNIDIETSTDGERYTAQLKGLHALKEKLEPNFPKPVAALYLRVRFHYVGKATAPAFRIRELEPVGG